MERKLTRKGKKVFVLADHTKFDRTTLAVQASLEEIDCIITDKLADKNYMDRIRAFGIEVVCV